MKIEISISEQACKEDPDLVRYLQALQLLANRMAVSHYKYGEMSNKYPDCAKAIDSVQKRVGMYNSSGNTENMLDAANFAIIEFLFPSHQKAHFRAQESHESPGIVHRED